jgi:hypothetical protein
MPKKGADFVHKMEAVLDVYERPYDPTHPVICLDESPKQIISETKKSYMDSKGILHQDYEYKREGVKSMYMIVEPLGEYREVHIEDNHNSQTYAKIIMNLVEKTYSAANKITLVEDNLSAHKLSTLYEIMPAPRARNIVKKIEVVRTPAHASWLNIAECELSVLTRCGLKSRMSDEEQLKKQTKAWYEYRNKNQKGVDWQFTTSDARIKLKNLYPDYII